MADWLNDVDEHLLTQFLGEWMSAISEDCYYAGWLMGTEYMVPALCARAIRYQRAQRWAHGEVGLGTAKALQKIADQLGYWANLADDGDGYVAFNPWPTPPEHTGELDRWIEIWKEGRKQS